MILWVQRNYRDGGLGVVTIFAGLMFVFLRILGKGDEAVTTALWYNVLGHLPPAAALYLGADWPDGQSSLAIWGMLVAVGVMASFQQFLMALSHRFAPASVLALCITPLSPWG